MRSVDSQNPVYLILLSGATGRWDRSSLVTESQVHETGESWQLRVSLLLQS